MPENPNAIPDALNVVATLVGLVTGYRREGETYDPVPLIEALADHLPAERAIRSLVALAASGAGALASTDWQPDEDDL